MATPVITPPEPTQQISDFARIPGVLFSPGATFTDIARRPTWIAPVVVLTILSLVLAFFLSQKMDWSNFVRHQQEKSSRWQQMTDEQKDASVALGAKIGTIGTWVGGAVGILILILIISLSYMLAFNVMSGSQLRFSTSLAVVAYSFVPAIISSILAIVVVALKRYGDVDPTRMLATGVAAFLPADAPSWQVSLGGSLELFWIWTMILMAIGYNKANPKKISSGTAFGIVFGLWAAYVLIKVGISAAF